MYGSGGVKGNWGAKYAGSYIEYVGQEMLICDNEKRYGKRIQHNYRHAYSAVIKPRKLSMQYRKLQL
jgi:hypothetical protein